MRDRLIELIKQAEKQECLNAVCGDIDFLIDSPKGAEFIADYLLANGVIVPPCKVGDIVYQVDTLFEEVMITELKVVELTIDNKGIRTLYGATSRGSIYVFDRGYGLSQIKFTKEEAEAKLKGEQ